MEEQETWKDIPGLDGLYQASNIGRIKILSRETKNNRGSFRTKEKFSSLSKINSSGYYEISVTVNGIKKSAKVHRLIGISFIENPDNKPEINHKNGIKTDNRVSNLEWATHQENIEHAKSMGLMKAGSLKGKTNVHPSCKPVIQKSLDGSIINTYHSLSEAARQMKVRPCSITDAIYGKCHTCKGYKWEYETPK